MKTTFAQLIKSLWGNMKVAACDTRGFVDIDGKKYKTVKAGS